MLVLKRMVRDIFLLQSSVIVMIGHLELFGDPETCVRIGLNPSFRDRRATQDSWAYLDLEDQQGLRLVN